MANQQNTLLAACASNNVGKHGALVEADEIGCVESLAANLKASVSAYLEPEHILKIEAACKFGAAAHEGQFRRTGEPYITHPIEVAIILSKMRIDADALIAAILHDTIEDTSVTKACIEEQFGQAVAEMVDGVTKISQIQFKSRAEAQAANFRKMVMAMTQDIRVILIKLADRLHNMRTLGVMQPHKKRRIAKETLEIYAPIANRLGMNDFRMEFEDLGLKALYPVRLKVIQDAVAAARGRRREVMGSLLELLNNRFKKEGVKAKIIGREKHLYSIYTKMKVQRKSFQDIMDVYGVRVITNDVDTCYRALGVVHNLFKPIPGRFKDLIAIPKTNGYQSLHTTLIGFNGIPIEVQIRTEEMDNMANYGVAAHWYYKSGEAVSNRTQQWLKSLLDIQQQAGNPLEFIENVKDDLFPDEVYVFTPKGKIMELPIGATPVDFAYAVHTDIGNTCVAARVDRRLMPLSTPLKSGQTVEIITAPGATPNPAWLGFVNSVKSRANIRHFLKHQRSTESRDLGERLLNNALSRYGVRLETVADERITAVLKESNLKALDDLLQQIGIGDRMAQIVAMRLLAEEEGEPGGFDGRRPLVIKGTEGLVINFARCCRPIPGDSIIGHISAGKGIVVHRDVCRNLINEMRDNPDKCVSVNWSDEVNGDYPVEMRLELENSRGALATIASVISEAQANIEHIDLHDRDAQISVATLRISVSGRSHMAKVMRRLRALAPILKVYRTRS